MRPTILLDLNFTLVANSATKLSPFTAQIAGETYHPELVDLIRRHDVILVTARPERHRVQTMASIKAKTLWSPSEAFFNDQGLPPPQCKEAVLLKLKERPGLRFVAIESNPATRAMYARHGIRAVTREQVLAQPLIIA